jgi:hypothetical protein
LSKISAAQRITTALSGPHHLCLSVFLDRLALTGRTCRLRTLTITGPAVQCARPNRSHFLSLATALIGEESARVALQYIQCDVWVVDMIGKNLVVDLVGTPRSGESVAGNEGCAGIPVEPAAVQIPICVVLVAALLAGHVSLEMCEADHVIGVGPALAELCLYQGVILNASLRDCVF